MVFVVFDKNKSNNRLTSDNQSNTSGQSALACNTLLVNSSHSEWQNTDTFHYCKGFWVHDNANYYEHSKYNIAFLFKGDSLLILDKSLLGVLFFEVHKFN